MTDSLKDAHEAIDVLYRYRGTSVGRMRMKEEADDALDKAVEEAQEAAEKRMREFLDKRLAADRERVLREVESRGRDGFTVEQAVHAVRNDMGLLQSQPVPAQECPHVTDADQECGRCLPAQEERCPKCADTGWVQRRDDFGPSIRCNCGEARP